MASVFPPLEEARRYAVAPGSITWQRAGDARAMLAAGAALVLQVAHPTVAAGVREHSDFKSDPWGRLLRTLDYVNLLVYGGPDAAIQTGRRMRAMHQRIKGIAPDGTRYHALEPEAYAWVHATLAEGIVAAHDRFGVPLTWDEKERFWAEWRGLGRLLGVRERDLPATWPGLREWVDVIVAERLRDSDVVRDVLEVQRAVDKPPVRWLGRRTWRLASLPASRLMQLATVDLLPPALQDKLDVRLTRAQALEVRAVGAASRAATPVLPGFVRTFGPPYLRWREPQITRGMFGADGAVIPAAA
jgi:uncharacterized protein (DUF2236 family)